MNQLGRDQQEIGEASEHGRQQENGNGDTEKQSSGRQHAILDPKGHYAFTWHVIFLVSCVIAIQCVDPLFLYVPVINQNDKCVMLNKRLMITATCLRSISDLFYIANIILGYFSLRYHDHQQPRQIVNQYLMSRSAILDILAILPIPQVLVPITLSKLRSSKLTMFLNLCVFSQLVPRVLRIYLSWRKHIKNSEGVRKGTWVIKTAFNIFLYIFASNIIGSLWYYFSIQREVACWHVACVNNNIGCTSTFKCGHNSAGNYALLDDACPIYSPNTTVFEFGIFENALKTGIVASNNIPQKIVRCFWWGLQNLSSLGQNLETSSYLWENVFAVFISIYGLLMLLYFIGNAQTYMQIATERTAKKAERAAKKADLKAKKDEEISSKMILITSQIELWMARNHLPDNMKERIITCIQHKLEKNNDIDMDKPMSHLSKDLIAEIKHHLCLPLLKNVVQNLEDQGDQNLPERICKYLKPKYYNEDIYILQERQPLTAMVFITQGSVWCFKSSNGHGSDQPIDKFELYGEELVQSWLNHYSPHKELPTATKTVKTESKVEAFALMASDLKHLVPKHTRAAKAVKDFAHEVIGRLSIMENAPDS